MSTFGQRIRQRREALKITQEELADMVNKDQNQIWRYESGQTVPSAKVIADIAISLNTTIDWLMGLTDNPDRPLRDERDLDELELQILEMLRNYDASTKQRAINVLKALG